MEKLEIIASAEKIVEGIHEYSVSQKDLWRRVPWLALEADGRGGWSDTYQKAYTEGLWQIDSCSRIVTPNMYVDLDSGKLISFRSNKKVVPPANEVLKLAYNSELIDASKVMKDLEYWVTKPYTKPEYVEIEPVWKSIVRHNLGLTELYTRK
jgi:hypothetical protein